MNSFEVGFKARQPVFWIGNNIDPTEVWLFCHGYGQTAEEFAVSFREMENNKVLLVFPEALSRFYKRGHHGPVGGSWMTRLHRQLDIENQNEYLTGVWNDMEKKGILKKTKKRVGFGFSQGGATIARWADQYPDMVDEIILWGCKFPPDLQDEQLKNFRDNKVVRSFIGNKDEFFPPEELKKLQNIFSNIKNLDWQLYDGGHALDPKILHSFFNK